MGGDIEDITGGVDTSRADEAGDFDVLPPGWYPAEVEEAEIRDTKAGNGKFLKVRLCVVGERFVGRKLFVRMNLVNPNPKAQEIGQRELASLGRACGLTVVRDTESLLGKLVDCKVTVRKGQGDFGDDNTIREYAAVGTKSAGGSRTPSAPSRREPDAAPPPAAKAAGKRPWER